MFSKVLVKITGILLILYISATSASPTTPQPASGDSDAQESNGDIHARARPPYRPFQCIYPYAWIRRECVGALGPRAWQDVCGWATWATRFQTDFDNKPGICPVNTYCLDTLDADNRIFITCVSTDKAAGKRKLDEFDPQIGTSDPKRARTGTQLGNTQLEYSVKIDHDMTGATVAAVLTSDDGSFLIAPNNVLVGNIHGKKQEVCHGDKASRTKARECYPNGKYNFKTGETIDFTWGMTGDQEGKLLYGILPAK